MQEHLTKKTSETDRALPTSNRNTTDDSDVSAGNENSLWSQLDAKDTKHGSSVGGARLTKEDRAAATTLATNNLQFANTNYHAAAQRVETDLKADSDSNDAFAMALLDIGLGLALPFGFAQAAKAAISALASAPTAAAKLAKIAASPSVATLVAGVGNIAKGQVKLPAGNSHASKAQFLRSMADCFGGALQTLTAQLPNLSDEQLLATCANFDQAVASADQYAQLLRDAVEVLDALGNTYRKDGGHRSPDEHHWDQTDRVAYIGENDNTSNQLAIILKVSQYDGQSSTALQNGSYFKRWVSTPMRESALAKAAEKGQTVERIHPTDIINWLPESRFPNLPNGIVRDVK
jgi:hypothetical protein